MSRIPDQVVENVRDSADIVTIISEGVDLKRSGSDYRGPCPFHGGAHRNFSVSPKRGSFYCFVCHEKGDVFSYLMKRFGMDYPTAVREIARRSGIVIPEDQSAETADPREPLFQALAAAQDWYSRALHEHASSVQAREYLSGRGISTETAEVLGLGYAVPGRSFQDAMTALGVEDTHLVEAGLLGVREDGSRYPRFRARLLFPIQDLRGRVVGFGGRILGSGEPKYLNSPETPVFRKGALLYNLHQAKQAIRKEDSSLVVEGYFDVIRMNLAGIDNVVAPLGTALTVDQAALLTRFSHNVTLLYDSDRAGLRATFRSGDELLRQRARVRVASIPPGEDPDTLLVKGGTAALDPIMRDAVDILERKLQVLQSHGWLDGLDHRRSSLDKLLPTIRAAEDNVTRDMYIGWISERTGVSRVTLEAEVAFVPTVPKTEVQSAVLHKEHGRHSVEDETERDRWLRKERSLLHILLCHPVWLERARDEVSQEWFTGSEYKEILLSLFDGSVTLTQPDSFYSLSPRAQMASSVLRNPETFIGMNIDEEYVGLCAEFEAKPLIKAVRFQLKRSKVKGDDQIEALTAAAQLAGDLSVRLPTPWQKQVYRRLFLKLAHAQREADLSRDDASRDRKTAAS